MRKSNISFSEKLRRRYRNVNSTLVLQILTVFQLVTFLPAVIHDKEFYTLQALMLIGFIAYEWIYITVMQVTAKKTNFELELIAFFLCGVGLAIITSINKDMLKTQLIAIILGSVIYTFFVWFLEDVDRVTRFRLPVAILALAFFGASFVFIRFKTGQTNGAYNWIKLGGFSIQPAEFVKIAFVFVGGAALDKLLTTKSIVAWATFVAGCLGILVLMKDFGTALIFFVSFIIIVFLRSGDLRTIGISVGVAGLGVGALLFIKPYVAKRFQGWGHVWNYINDSRGYQQARTLIYSASGGLLGLGIGKGKLRYIFAAENDLIFGVVCEELGLLIGFAIVICFALICIYSVVNAHSAPSTFYSISACTASAMLLFQTCLNIFGITDLLPLTGVTLPFVSQGGSSMICCWALFAFIKAADIRTYPKMMNQE